MTELLKSKSFKKLLRTLKGKPSPKNKTKLRSRITTSKKNSYSRKRKPSSLTKRKQTEFERGLGDAKKLTTRWNSQTNPPKVYIGDTRVHHGEVGVVLGLIGIFSDDKRLTGLGTGLALDDLHDMPEWFTFKKRNDFSGYA